MGEGSVSTATVTGSENDSVPIDMLSIEQGQLPEVHTYYEERDKQKQTKERSVCTKHRLALYFGVGTFFTSILTICVVVLLQKNHHKALATPSISNYSKNATTENDATGMLSSPIGKACYFLGFTNMYDCKSSDEFEGETVDSEDPDEIQFRTIPTEIGLLTHLRKINFHKNSHLEGTFPTEIGMLTQLVSLQVHGLGLIGAIPSTIGRLTLLESLQMQNNYFTGSIPTTFASLSNLVDINLSSNELSGKIPSIIFQTWANNLNVWFQNNRLTGTIPSSIGSMKRCEVIFLSDNRFSGSIPKSVGNMSSLGVFMVHNNGLTGHIPNALLSSQSLLRLYVTNNTNLNGSISLIQTRSPINEMVLTNTSISGVIPKSLCRFHHDNVHYEIDCQNDSISNKPKIQCNCCLSYDGNACPDSTWVPDS
jgi:hypothetical protein